MAVLPKTTLAYWRIWLSARCLPAIASGRSLGSLLAYATPTSVSPSLAALAPQDIIDTVKRVARRPWMMRSRRCLREGLLAFRYLSLAGHDPELHFGVDPKTLQDKRPRAHCWLSLDNKTVLNPDTENMLVLHTHRRSENQEMPAILAASGVTDG